MSSLPLQSFASHASSLTPTATIPCLDCNRVYSHAASCPRSNGDPNTPVGRDDVRSSDDPDPEPGHAILRDSAAHQAEIRRFDAWRAEHVRAARLSDDPADDAPADEPEPFGPDPDDDAWLATQAGAWDMPAPAEPRLPAPDTIGVQAGFLRSLGTDLADLMAESLDALAADWRACETPGASMTVAEFRARRERMEAWAGYDLWARAEEQGRAMAEIGGGR